MSTANINARGNPADLKVICVGLGRTGTMSLRTALVMLGFGPPYHIVDVIQQGRGGEDLKTWAKIGDGEGTPEDFDNILRGYGCILEYPPAMYHAELYAAYPDAKFILTTRDPAEWEKSMKATILPKFRMLREDPNKSVFWEAYSNWMAKYVEDKYHRGRWETHAQQELLDHNERVKRNIPADKLLVYEVGEGWDRLVEFLDVPKPETPFPHINDTAQFLKNSEKHKREGFRTVEEYQVHPVATL